MPTEAARVDNGSISSTGHSVAFLRYQEGCRVYRVRGAEFEVDSRYSVVSIVGQGSYGVVCSAVDDVSGTKVAIKKAIGVFDDLIDGRRLWREISLMRLLREAGCRNILPLHRVMLPQTPATFGDVYLVTELAERDLLASMRMTPVRSDIETLRRIAVQLLRCVSDMHHLGVIHRDIKSGNILLKGLEAYVCDFGLARGGFHAEQGPPENLVLTDYVVTRWYRAPELLLMCRYGYPVDVWAAAVVLIEFYNHRAVFAGGDYIQQLKLIAQTVPIDLRSVSFIEESSETALSFLQEIVLKNRGARPLSQFLEDMPPDGVDLITKMVVFNPHDRITAHDALRHPFFASVGGDGRTTPLQMSTSFDFSLDAAVELTEPRLRRRIIEEAARYKT